MLAQAAGAVPWQRRFRGAVLVSDIAGFSRLTEGFAARGPEGAEQLAAVLDAWFGRMTEAALEHGGDVVDFVGDALVVVWPGDDLQQVLGDTARAALSLLAAGEAVAASTGLQLKQRIALDAGELALFAVGEDRQRQALVAGAPMARAAALYRRGYPGDILVGGEHWPRLAPGAQGQQRPGGEWRLLGLAERTPPQPATAIAAVEDMEPFLPPALLARSRAGNAPWPGEYRQLSTLMLGFPDLDPAAPDALERLQAAVGIAQRELRRSGGRIERLSMDDKGISILSAWGLPQASFEDDTARALRAASDIDMALRRQGITGALGLASGRVFCGDIGGLRRRHLGLAGASVNRAARLMQLGPGLRCDAAIAQEAPRGWSFEPEGTGADAPLRPLQRALPPPLPQAEITLIGRVVEQRRIGQTLRQAVVGQGSLLLMLGEAGIGKSRLLADGAARAVTRGLRTLATGGLAVESSTPYFPWRRLLERLLLGEAMPEPDALLQTLERELAGVPRLQAWLPLLKDILPLRIEDNELTPQITGAARSRALQDLVCHLLERSAPAPLLLLDDLHWWDEASLALLEAVLQRLPQLAAIAASRPEAEVADTASTSLRRLLRRESAQLLQLEALQRAAAAEVAARTLGLEGAGAALPETLVELLYQRTGGNPFFCEELALALRDSGAIRLEGGGVRLRASADEDALAEAPTTLRGAIVSRYDRLRPTAQAALKLASVIGRAFHPPTLAALLGGPDMDASLAQLREAGLLRLGEDGQHHFKHALLRDVVYELLPFAQRRALHRDVALQIEALEEGGIRAAELAMHWEGAGDVARALHHLERAAQHALARDANREAIRHVQRAYALAARLDGEPEPERLAEWEAILGDAYQELFEYVPSVRHYHRALELMGRPGRLGSLRRVWLLLRETTIQGWHRRRPPQREGDAARLARLSRAAHIHQRLVETAFFDNRPAELLYQTLASVNLAEKTDFTYVRVSSYAGLAMACMAMRQLRLADDYSARSLAAARDGALADVAYSHLGRMVYRCSRGQWDQVHESYAAGTPMYRSLGITGRWQQIRVIDVVAWTSQGEYAEALAGVREVMDSPGAVIPAQIHAWCWAYEALIAAVWEPARERLPALARQYAALPLAGVSLADRMLCVCAMAQAQWLLGSGEAALALVDEALALAKQAPPATYYLTPALAAAAAVCFVAHEAEADALRRSQHLQRCTDLAGVLKPLAWMVPSATPHASLVQARVHWLQGAHGRAESTWSRALAQAQALAMPREEAQALEAMGRWLDPDSVQAAQRRTAALEIYARLNVAETAPELTSASAPSPR